MDSSIINVGDNQPRLKVSISARLIAALLFSIPTFGGALSSFFLMAVMQGLRNAESAGIDAVIMGMVDAMKPALGFLYLGALAGIGVIVVLIVRMFMLTKTATPPSWFFIIIGLLFLVPAGLFFEAQSLIIEVLINPRDSQGLGAVGENISLLLILSLVAAPVVFIILTVLALLPLSTSARPRVGPFLTATAIEILLIAVAIAFHMRFRWLYQWVIN